MFCIIRSTSRTPDLRLRTLDARPGAWVCIRAETTTAPQGPHATERSTSVAVLPSLEDGRGHRVVAERVLSGGGEPLTGVIDWIFRWPYEVDLTRAFRLSDGDRWSVSFTCLDVDDILDQRGRE
ncbi:hypothetical protein PED38_14570 [Clavibacter sp. CT19]|uniref:hypothetical protein n=1 Tax=Clavibacter sp. CT19 TaxID=3018990 RepID=UPI0022EAF116|nr:hypothetical protein [Clavibacter sp. CT19]MDA3806024.1 hypothetical protein [Clavibacter sp. CT19]